jgi:hypothetical protein
LDEKMKAAVEIVHLGGDPRDLPVALIDSQYVTMALLKASLMGMREIATVEHVAFDPDDETTKQEFSLNFRAVPHLVLDPSGFLRAHFRVILFGDWTGADRDAVVGHVSNVEIWREVFLLTKAS